GRVPFEYKNTVDYTIVEPDSGYGTAGAKLDPRTGALMYDRYEDIYGKQHVTKEDMKEDLIEFSKDSQAMIHLKEEFETIFSAKGDVRRHIGKGVISVRNLSDKDRLWDVDVWLREETGIAEVDFDKIAAVEIEPGFKVSKEYRINQFEPSIIIHELISTHPEYPESIIFEKHKSTQVTFQLGVVNHGTSPYTGMVLRKEIPSNLRNIIISKESEEDASLNENELVWRINELKPNEAKVLRFGADIDAESPEETPTGEITLKATGEDTLTVFTITAFEGMCKNMYFVEADETDEPGKWLCNFICENTSSFGVEILRAEVRDARGENIFLNIDRPGIKLPPNDRWESKSWIVEGKGRPSFIKSLVLKVIPSISKEITFNLTKESDMFRMAGLEFSKTFDKDVVVAGRVTDAVAGIEIKNVGSSPMEHIVVRDTLPKFMTPPTSFRIDRDGVPLTENVKISIAPEDGAEAVDQQHSIIIRDLS
ncbi:MAG: hypothetical protein KAJ51_01690, partial [Thermoplasmata archaeon]|nr:hypothetical protein [Thermoplasmata archaeon]